MNRLSFCDVTIRPRFKVGLRRSFSRLGGYRKRFARDCGNRSSILSYAGTRHTIRVRSGRVYVRISDVFRSAPTEVIRALAFLLVARLLSRKPPHDQERLYRSYAYSPEVLRASDLARRQRGRKVISTASGRVLRPRSHLLACQQKAFLTARLKTRSDVVQTKGRAAFWDITMAAHDTITISKTLDSPEVPECRGIHHVP